MNLRFKTRIALFNTLAVALTTALVFVVIYSVVHKTAYNHLDEDISLEKNEVFNNLDWHQNTIRVNKMPEWDEAEHNKVEVNPTFLQIVDINGTVIFHSANLLKDQFLYNPKSEQEIFYNGEINNQKIRFGQFPIINNEQKIIGQLTIAVSEKESYVILNNLILVLLISFPIVLLIQFIASSFAASKAIKPVHELIKTTSGISDLNIGTRLTLPERHDELYVLTNTINELLARIEKSMIQQKQFTSDASHEIRTPLSAIRGTLEVLLRKKREPQVYEAKITDVISQVDRLNILLDQLLQLARIESDLLVIKKTTVSLSGIISGLEDKWKQEAINKNIKVHISIPETTEVIGNKLYLELILNNLVSNAMKYGKENGSIFISWNSTSNTFSIKDDGIGISANDVPNIFNRFYRADESRSTFIKGNGLGLSIVKKLSNLQDITLSVESELGLGSTFTLQF
jgi:signal transduction histidine kinase